MSMLRRQLGFLLLVSCLALAQTAAAPAVFSEEGEWRGRDQWQRPPEVMDALGVREGGVVADIGASTGYFTFHLAERVGRKGRVYGVDISRSDVERMQELARKHHYSQVVPVLGDADDPKLPTGELDAILVVNSYHEFRQHEAMLQAMHRALKPGGRLGIIDREGEARQDRSSYHSEHRIPLQLVRQEAERAGFRYQRRERGFTTDRGRKWWFLIFEK